MLSAPRYVREGNIDIPNMFQKFNEQVVVISNPHRDDSFPTRPA